MAGKKNKKKQHPGEPIHINPIALIKAKIVYNFGLSECSRVKGLSYKMNSVILGSSVGQSWPHKLQQVQFLAVPHFSIILLLVPLD